MSKNFTKLVVGALFVMVGIAVFCFYQYMVAVRENAALQTDLDQVQEDIRQLALIRDNLNSDLQQAQASEQALILENTGLKEQVKQDQVKFSDLEGAIQEAQNNINALNEQITLAREENTALVTQVGGLKEKLSAVSQENDQMEATLSSVDAMKKAIKALKIKTRAARRAARQSARRPAPVKVVADAKKQVQEITLGNQGFIIKNGKVIMTSRVRIEVQPSPESKQ